MAYKFNSGILFPPILALSTSIGVLPFMETLLSLSTKNSSSSIFNVLIPMLLFILVPILFFLGVGLLIIQAAVPSNSPLGELYAVPISWMTRITVNLALVCLLTEVAIGVYLVLPGAISAWWFVW